VFLTELKKFLNF